MRGRSWWKLWVVVFAISVFGLTNFARAEEITPNALRAKQLQWRMVYEHDENGVPISGDINKLINAVRKGADVKVGYTGTESEIFFPCQWVYIVDDGAHVIGMNTSNINAGNFGFDDDAYHHFQLVKTTGEVDISRWSVGEHTDRGHTQERQAMKWFIRR